MRAWQVTGPDTIALREVPVPEPGPGEVRVRVRAFGINRADLLQRKGLYAAPPGAPRDVLGLEYAGQVDALGPPLDRSADPPSRPGRAWARGESVMGITAGGAYAEYVVQVADQVLPVPKGWSWSNAAAVPEAFLTAYDALERAVLTGGEWLLVHAAGSGVGTAALQLAEARGAPCVGTSRTPEKLARAAGLGLTAGVRTDTGDWVDTVRRITEGGAHAALDLVGGALFPGTLSAMRSRGRVVLVGLTAGRRADVDLGLVLRQRLRIEGTVLRGRPDDEKADLTARFAEAVLPLLTAGAVRPVVDRVFGFEAVEEAHAVMGANATFGKLVVEIA